MKHLCTDRYRDHPPAPSASISTSSLIAGAGPRPRRSTPGIEGHRAYVNPKVEGPTVCRLAPLVVMVVIFGFDILGIVDINQKRRSRQIFVNAVPVGGGAPISIQSMTNTEKQPRRKNRADWGFGRRRLRLRHAAPPFNQEAVAAAGVPGYSSPFVRRPISISIIGWLWRL